ncbi:glycosyltransferase family 4 protein [Naasia sp. SYSU D00057]|uniref:glycosyltransferase family 4 protein n=1 Tax=Naasia sp. SYSU D00057 TaxID=2817380 RepID=UPI001B3019B7|nr:glycosyltransferase family 4 protein [Naasia sp. SYSU D00057]
MLIAKFVPWPPNSGEKRRTLAVARAFLALGTVTIAAFESEYEDAAPLRAEGFDVRTVPLRRTALKTARGLLRTRSITASRFWDRDLAGLVSEVARADSIDVTVVEHVQLRTLASAESSSVRVIDMHNVESLLAKRMSETRRGLWRWIYGLEARALRRLERRVSDVDLVAVVSEADRVALAQHGGAVEVVVVPNAWDATTPLPAVESPVVSFVALLSWAPNVDAVKWFCGRVWPCVIDAIPGAKLQLVGRDPHPDVRALASDSIVVTGTVDSLAPWYERTAVTVAPLLAGGGSRLKILESLSYGRPVVATTVGAEGLEDLVGRGVILADEPGMMASEIVALLNDPARAQRLGTSGAQAVEQDHSWSAAVAPLIAAVKSATSERLDR